MADSQWLDAFVLHRRPYRETSYLVDLFTRQAGKISVVAKGVRNSKSDKKSLLQPFQPLRVQCRGKSSLKNLSLVESHGRALMLTGNALFCGMYVNELTNRIMPPELVSEALFETYNATLTDLVSTSSIEISLREFEFAMLSDMGLMPDWTIDGQSGDAVEPGAFYQYISEVGVVRTQDVSLPHRIAGETLLALADGQWQEDTRRAAKLLSRAILAPLLGNKPLKSRALFVPQQRQ
ncbi:DNA repair protein RecO [Alteromonas sp. CYL-A6]|uniref:DNA repair protein RecO n=1 Tax=Alteromonas nitratireducens TaxID=3390813 RepID=UPI0034BDC17F